MIIPNLMPLYSYMKTVWCHPHFAWGEENIFEQICSNIRVHIGKGGGGHRLFISGQKYSQLVQKIKNVKCKMMQGQDVPSHSRSQHIIMTRV